MKRNIKYKSEELFNYYKKNRVVWSQLYKSERKLLNKLQLKNKEILDVGCACGGLGDILKKKFNIKTYTGIEIHKKQYNYAKNKYKNFKFINKDILNFNTKKKYDYVISFSCIDWNIDFKKMLNKLTSFVKNNGFIILTLRFTDKKDLISIRESYQYINYNNSKKGEKAAYIVLNKKNFLYNILNKYNVKNIIGYEYSLKKPKTAINKYNKINYWALAINFSNNQYNKKINIYNL